MHLNLGYFTHEKRLQIYFFKHYVLSIMSFHCRKYILISIELIAENSCVIKIPTCSEFGVFVKKEMIESNLYLYYCNEIRHRHTLSGCEFVRQ